MWLSALILTRQSDVIFTVDLNADLIVSLSEALLEKCFTTFLSSTVCASVVHLGKVSFSIDYVKDIDSGNLYNRSDLHCKKELLV